MCTYFFLINSTAIFNWLMKSSKLVLTAHSCVFNSCPSSLTHAASLLNSLVVTAAKRCPFLSPLRSKTTNVWNRTCSLLACMAPPGMYSRCCLFPLPTTPQCLIITLSLLPLSDYISHHAGSHSVVLAAAVKAPHSVEAIELQDFPSTPQGWQLEEPDHSSPPREVGINRLLFYLPRECLSHSLSHSCSLTHYMGICQWSVTCCWPPGPLGGNTDCTIWNMSCLVHSQRRVAIWFSLYPLLLCLTCLLYLDHLTPPREHAWASFIHF